VSKTRFEAFSDGVFAFAATLLILGIALPQLQRPVAEADLTLAVVRLWPNLLAYLLGFSIIGVMWQTHHALFRIVDRVDRMTVFLNLGLLAITAFIPFATSTLGAYPTMRTSTFMYGITLTLSATMFNALAYHLTRARAFSNAVDAATIKQTVRAYRFGWLGYLLAAFVSFASPIASFALYLLIGLYFFIPRGIDSDLTLSDTPAPPSSTRRGRKKRP
jgi:uncharacterized membrane protein